MLANHLNLNKCNQIIEIKSRHEEDATNVLDFMASNGLVANKSKTNTWAAREHPRQRGSMQACMREGKHTSCMLEGKYAACMDDI